MSAENARISLCFSWFVRICSCDAVCCTNGDKHRLQNFVLQVSAHFYFSGKYQAASFILTPLRCHFLRGVCRSVFEAQLYGLAVVGT